MLSRRFSAYLPLNEKELELLWKEGKIVLDTSSLLQLYKYGPETRDEVMKLLTDSVQGRVWLPYQVGLEFFRNRLDLIEKDAGRLSQFELNLNSAVREVEKVLEEARLDELGHKTPVSGLMGNVRKALEPLTTALQAMSTKYPNLRERDTVVEFVDSLVGDSVGPAPTVDDVERWNAEASRRFESRRPPGYLDVSTKRDGEFVAHGVVYKLKYGDYFLWKQLLLQVQTNPKEFSKVILVTSDAKDDWWERSKGKTTTPRIELREEIAEHGAQLFHMYTLAAFLKWLSKSAASKKQLTDRALTEVRNTEEEANLSETNAEGLEQVGIQGATASDWLVESASARRTEGYLGYQSQRAVLDYVSTLVPLAKIRAQLEFPDLLCERESFSGSGQTLVSGFEVITPRDPKHLYRLVDRQAKQGIQWLANTQSDNPGDIVELTFVVTLHQAALRNYSDAIWASAMRSSRSLTAESGINIVFGLLGKKGFVPINADSFREILLGTRQ